ncbi:hypothetical protein [Streptacidiphilus carbonis]|uniref:hypothetical protein n=1 Tax=Streptacidiphilus carbonis TaxID=105422 RepID=UPI0005A74C2D|nr:hypothetical protein [Streptacidiphilus carbonis]
MGVIGLAVLYAAFALVALWLLGELLLQHRAAPYWRVLALLGFLALVAGVAKGSVPLIGGGVVAFGAGQYLVTRSVKAATGTHWSLRSPDGSLPGPLAGVPLLAGVFPAGEAAPAGTAEERAVRVGEVGPIEEAPTTIAYDPAAFEEEAAGEEYPQQQPYPEYVPSPQPGTQYSDGQYPDGQYSDGQYSDGQYSDGQYAEARYGDGGRYAETQQYAGYPQQDGGRQDYGYRFQEYPQQPAHAQGQDQGQVQYDANGYPLQAAEPEQQYAPQADYSYGYEQSYEQQPQAYYDPQHQYGYPQEQQPAEQPQSQPADAGTWQQQYG